jgi:hypothetical protein
MDVWKLKRLNKKIGKEKKKKNKKIRTRTLKMSSGLGEFDLSTFVCPFTNAILNEPVLADDGHTYSKHAILCWFKSLSERRLRIISPCTRECCKRKEISEHLVPNSDIAKSIEEYRKMRLKSVQEGLAGGKAAVGLDLTLAPKSLAELGAMFSLLDSLRQLLSETLKGWQIPNIVVVGQESSGKSSVLERLMMTPLLPRDENICTRLPIHVRLRRSDQPMPPMLEVYNTETETTEKGPYVIAAQYGNVDVSDEMRRILTEEQGNIHAHPPPNPHFAFLHTCMRRISERGNPVAQYASL